MRFHTILNCGAFAILVLIGGSVVKGEMPSSVPLNLGSVADVASTLADTGAVVIAPPLDPFNKGQWTFQAYGWGRNIKVNDGNSAGVNVGVGYFFADGMSFNVEAVGAWMNVKGGTTTVSGDTGAVGMTLLFRWHFLRGEGWSLFVDGGAGFLESGLPYPAGGTHFNFTPQGGIGGTLHLFDDVFLIGGARWSHISNANLVDGPSRNPGSDAIMTYLGVLLPF